MIYQLLVSAAALIPLALSLRPSEVSEIIALYADEYRIGSIYYEIQTNDPGYCQREIPAMRMHEMVDIEYTTIGTVVVYFQNEPAQVALTNIFYMPLPAYIDCEVMNEGRYVKTLRMMVISDDANGRRLTRLINEPIDDKKLRSFVITDVKQMRILKVSYNSTSGPHLRAWYQAEVEKQEAGNSNQIMRCNEIKHQMAIANEYNVIAGTLKAGKFQLILDEFITVPLSGALICKFDYGPVAHGYINLYFVLGNYLTKWYQVFTHETYEDMTLGERHTFSLEKYLLKGLDV